MAPYIILAALFGVPLLLALMLRVNAIFLFLSAAVGSLLVTHLGSDANNVADAFVNASNLEIYVNLGLLIVPIALTLLFLQKSMMASKFLLQIVPLIATCIMIGSLVLVQLPADIQNQVYGTDIGDVVYNSENVIVGAASILTLLLMWQSHHHKKGKLGKKHK